MRDQRLTVKLDERFVAAESAAGASGKNESSDIWFSSHNADAVATR